MSGYLCAWREWDGPLAELMQTISAAGDSYHHTSQWSDPYDDDADTEVDKIEAAARRVETRIAEQSAEVERLTALVAMLTGAAQQAFTRWVSLARDLTEQTEDDRKRFNDLLETEINAAAERALENQ